MSIKSTPLTEPLYDYYLKYGFREPTALTEFRQATEAHPQTQMQIAPEQAQFLAFLVKIIHARQILEVGTFLGYSSAALALALPDEGRLITCDIRDDWGQIAQSYWRKMGLRQKISQQIGPAEDTLKKLLDTRGPDYFDLAFIDADKRGYLTYYEQCLKLVRQGGIIAVDNTLWNGAVCDLNNEENSTQAIREFNAFVHQDKRVDLILVPIGDGCTLLRIK